MGCYGVRRYILCNNLWCQAIKYYGREFTRTRGEVYERVCVINSVQSACLFVLFSWLKWNKHTHTLTHIWHTDSCHAGFFLEIRETTHTISRANTNVKSHRLHHSIAVTKEWLLLVIQETRKVQLVLQKRKPLKNIIKSGTARILCIHSYSNAW